jgi:hypothetical protein
MQRSSSKPSLLLHTDPTVPSLGARKARPGKEALVGRGKGGKMATLYL